MIEFIMTIGVGGSQHATFASGSRVACNLHSRCEPAAGAVPAPHGNKDPVAATVGDEPIYAAEVGRLLAKTTGGKPVNEAAQPFLRAEILEEIVSRRLVLAYARRSGTAASPAEIDSALDELQAKLKSQHRSLDDFLRAQSATQDDLRRQLAWNLVWEKYLARYVTAERLAGYFQAHRRDLDGSMVSVSQILLRPAPAQGRRRSSRW